MYIFLICLSIDDHLGHSHILAILNGVETMNNGRIKQSYYSHKIADGRKRTNDRVPPLAIYNST